MHIIGLHEVKVQPAPLHAQCDPPLQSTLHETAALQSMLHVDFAEHETSAESPAATTTAQVLPPPQLALHALPVSHVNRQSQPFIPQLNEQVAAAAQDCAQQGLQTALQSDEQPDTASVMSVVARFASARSALSPGVAPPGEGSNKPIPESAPRAGIATASILKLHAFAATSTVKHIHRIRV